MVHTYHPVMTHHRLLLFKWLMVLIPPVTVAVGHILLALTVGHSLPGHTVGSLAETLLVTLLVTCLGLVLAYLFVETLFTLVFANISGGAPSSGVALWVVREDRPPDRPASPLRGCRPPARRRGRTTPRGHSARRCTCRWRTATGRR